MQLLTNTEVAGRAARVNGFGYGIAIDGQMPEDIEAQDLQELLGKSLGGVQYAPAVYGADTIGKVQVINLPVPQTAALVTTLAAPNVQYRREVAGALATETNYVIPKIRFPTLSDIEFTAAQIGNEECMRCLTCYQMWLARHYGAVKHVAPYTAAPASGFEGLIFDAARGLLLPVAGTPTRALLCEYEFTSDMSIDCLIYQPELRRAGNTRDLFETDVMAGLEPQLEALVDGVWTVVASRTVGPMVGTSGVATRINLPAALVGRKFRQFRLTLNYSTTVGAYIQMGQFMFFGTIEQSRTVPDSAFLLLSQSSATYTTGTASVYPKFNNNQRGLAIGAQINGRPDLPRFALTPLTFDVAQQGMYMEKPLTISMLATGLPAFVATRDTCSTYEVY